MSKANEKSNAIKYKITKLEVSGFGLAFQIISIIISIIDAIKFTKMFYDSLFDKSISNLFWVFIIFVISFFAFFGICYTLYRFTCKKYFDLKKDIIDKKINSIFSLDEIKNIDLNIRWVDKWARGDIPLAEPIKVFYPGNKHYKFLSIEKDNIIRLVDNIINSSYILSNIEKDELIKLNNLIDKINYLRTSEKLFLKSKININEILKYENINNIISPIQEQIKPIKLLKKGMSQCEKEKFDQKADELLHFVKESQYQHEAAKRIYEGEVGVNNHLDMYNDILTNYSNIRFEIEGESIETHNIVVCDNGIFALVVKNYGDLSQTIHISNDGQWTRLSKNKQMPMKDVLEKHNRRVAYMQKDLNKELKEMGYDIPYIYITPIIVIVNDNINIVNESDILIIRTSNIYNTIRKHKSGYILHPGIKLAIDKIINKNMKKTKAYPITSYKYAIISRFKNLINEYEQYSSSLSAYESYYKEISDLGYDVRKVIVKTETSKGIKPSDFVTLRKRKDNESNQ